MNRTINVTKPYLADEKEYTELLHGIWERDWLTNDGPLSRKLCDGLKEYLGLEHLCLTTNGHLALENTVKMIPKKGKVITTPFTFASTTHAIVRSGYEPVFCDIRESDLTMDPDACEKLIDADTAAILPVHVYGHPCDVRAFEKLAEKYDLTVIYDAAHSFGARLEGRSLCDYGDMSILSFHATKLFHTVEGGAAVCHDEETEKKLNYMRNFGIANEVSIPEIGGNAKMSEFHAAMGLVNLNHIREIIEERKALTLRYRKNLSELRGIRYFVPEDIPGFVYNYAYFPVLIDPEEFGASRDDVYDELKKYQINARKYFYPLTSSVECYAGMKPAPETPVAQKAAGQVLTLPLFNGLKTEEADEICSIIAGMRQ